MLKKFSSSEKQTMDIGSSIAKHLGPGGIVCLFGTLGSGKTILAKGIARAYGIKPEEVISPTFVLMREHICKKNKAVSGFYHFDLYRMQNLKDIADLGYEEYFYGQGITVVEWAEKLKGLLPKELLKVSITFKDASSRKIEITAQGEHYKKILKKL